MKHRLGLKALLAVAAAAFAAPALAHPHVWVTARAEMVYDGEGRITGIRHAWTFDKAYSALVTQGLDKDGDGKLTPEALQGIARENAEGLTEFDCFTILKARGKKQEFGTPRDYGMTYADGAVTLAYFLPLRTPATLRTATLEIYDPSYFVSFSLADGNAVTLAGAPQGCATNISQPEAAELPQPQTLPESFFQNRTAAADMAVQFASRAIIACP